MIDMAVRAMKRVRSRYQPRRGSSFSVADWREMTKTPLDRAQEIADRDGVPVSYSVRMTEGGEILTLTARPRLRRHHG